MASRTSTMKTLLVILGTSRYQDGWKWFLPASRSSLNPPGPPRKAKHVSFRTRFVREKFGEKSLLALLTPFLGTPPGEMDQYSPFKGTHEGIDALLEHRLGGALSKLSVLGKVSLAPGWCWVARFFFVFCAGLPDTKRTNLFNIFL